MTCGSEENIWVFGYGSLMWRPGFDHEGMVSGRVYGYHRALCIQSIMYRGTKENPGLVVGLDNGGSCRGRAIKVPRGAEEAVFAYLDEREKINDVYCSKWVPVALDDGRRVKAYTFVANRTSPHYKGKLSDDEVIRLVLNGVGREGRALDYLRNTVSHLDDLGIREGRLHGLLMRAERIDQNRD
ncbi:MAG: gamma-glutamylcyclotransferase [Rhodospirillales bacterium]|nr:gamma-glutamylcyclotransferase [Rhodospirillales bacterium]MCW8861191.1 gamma-glutamylcyclotransferase [Rhodospirillales bacterium]MCW8951285.1 gamma-glutamylcyclotransferase [Rhodospirillales bacterium]MCW9002662.1 gamma-glutamylcyclotransferase [Rhodospirillales bacterium]MCW9039564.1 gamma-glutamylcyclotransferase [Rhodospirillales bacterium]